MGIQKLFKDSLEIYSYSESQDTLGDAVKTWTKTSTILGFLNDTKGGKKFVNNGIETMSTATMFCATTVTLTTKMRVKSAENGMIYDVLYVNIPITSLKQKKKFITADLQFNSEASL